MNFFLVKKSRFGIRWPSILTYDPDLYNYNKGYLHLHTKFGAHRPNTWKDMIFF